MTDILIPTVVVVLGECCLVLDLGNRLFGSYARTPLRALVRISVVVLACIVLVLPLLLALVEPSIEAGAWVIASSVVSVLIVGHFLFPYRFGIRRIRSARVSESEEALSTSLVLESITITRELRSAGPPQIVALVLSDLHCNTEAKLHALADALASLAERAYDVVFVLGDLGENRAIIPELLKAIRGVSPKHGVFLVRSNHDCERGRSDLIAQSAEEHSIRVLSNAEHLIDDIGLSVVGLEYPWCQRPLPSPCEAPVAVGLTHTPDNISWFDRLGVPLVLAGHTHGGKLRLPLVGAVLVPSRYGRFLDKGWFQLRDTFIYITAGIGYFPGMMGKKGTLLELTIRNVIRGQENAQPADAPDA